MDFELDIFYSKLVRGRLPDALEYLRKFPEQSARYDRYVSRFEKNEQNDISGDVILDDVLRLYHGYYRDVFYLGADAQSAADKLRQALAVRFGSGSLDELEQGAVKHAFEKAGYSFLGGTTGGYYGPYIWKDTLDARYEVELPENEADAVLRGRAARRQMSLEEYLTSTARSGESYAVRAAMLEQKALYALYDTIVNAVSPAE